ncbi:bifunctional aspartate kinase/diaminopimelate decarboxylase [Balneolaceae bacterium YR4-1]|uniref:Diaminopimelate decarboxylase n=1 Tax=Halalkalibaculum roseum TaxID=2709311 RepID=A0A6M1SYF8_9BACT|nr:bifunctional aspartate kinase/diaminopimelate decarboxylase [Halalkalibaculum roseum]NGP76986.1 bifunctional aspartate kinase/diaminopimelate decarboxylase [Halalkalibaculum roseum]
MPERKNWIVLKFGGTSVSNRQNWDNIREVVKQHRDSGYKVCLVHSAVSGISNKLQEVIDQAPRGNYTALLDSIKDTHRDLADDLGLDAYELLGDYFLELDQLAKGIALVEEASFRVQAKLMSLGELMATTLGAAFLKKEDIETNWMDARDLLKTVPQKNASEKNIVLSAVCDDSPDKELQLELSDKGNVILTQGFIASDQSDKTVLLGRGGSDVSAAYLASKLKAEILEIWTDVPGMFTANPHAVPSARLLKHLSYEEAQEIATNGAKVLHPRCIMPARKHKIPVHIKCTHKPNLEGTVISSAVSDDTALVKAIAVRGDIILVSMESLGMWQQVGFLADVFEVFKNHGLSIDLVSTSESNVTVSLDPGLNAHFQDIRNEFVEELSAHCKVNVIESTSAVSLLGRHIRTILHQLGSAFEVFQEHQVYLLSQAANDLNFTFVVESEQADRLVRQLHEQVISQSGNQQSFGPTWPELMGDVEEKEELHEAWWKGKRDELVQLSREKGPSYVYSKDALIANTERLKELHSVDRFFYAMKANANIDVLKTFRSQDLGFECVSIGEVEEVFELFPDIDPGEVIFTPNFAPREEYEQAFDHGVNVTLDNIYPLQKWPEVFENRTIFLRIDPGHGHGHHDHVKTGGVHSKFGIPRFEIPEVKSIIDDISITVKGLHAHIGSGIKDPTQWKSTALILHEVAEELGGVDVLDLGGGFGIRENDTQASLNMKQVDELLKQFRDAHPNYELWVEPGRFLTATAGVLLANVTQLKGKGSVKYIGIDTGMNSFIRPALYGARHTIVNLSKLDKESTQVVNIVGPICESGDKLGIDRLFPESEEGDVILIANTGAYGRVMSSSYNLRMPATEILI